VVLHATYFNLSILQKEGLQLVRADHSHFTHSTPPMVTIASFLVFYIFYPPSALVFIATSFGSLSATQIYVIVDLVEKRLSFSGVS